MRRNEEMRLAGEIDLDKEPAKRKGGDWMSEQRGRLETSHEKECR